MIHNHTNITTYTLAEIVDILWVHKHTIPYMITTASDTRPMNCPRLSSSTASIIGLNHLNGNPKKRIIDIKPTNP